MKLYCICQCANCQGSACHRPSPPPSLPPTSVSIPSCTTPDSIQQVSKTTQNMLTCDQQAVTWDCELTLSSSRWPWALSVAEQFLLCASTLLLDSTSQIPFSRWDEEMEVMEQHHEVEIHWLWSASSPATELAYLVTLVSPLHKVHMGFLNPVIIPPFYSLPC